MKLYQISGLGANEKAFKNLRLHPDFEIIYLPWLQPETDESLSHYAQRMAENINPNEDFVMMGLSFGGIITKEINQFLHPKFNFLLSTIKDRSEMPSYMRFSSHTGAHKIIPPSFLTSDGFLSYSVFRKMYSGKLMDLKEVFEYRDHDYLKWAMDRIVNWQNPAELKNYLHIHGDKDVVFPYSHIHNAHKIEGGSHVMVLNKAKKISELINQELVKL